MTLNSSGPISLGGATAGQSVNLELGFSATATIAMNTTAVRTLAGFPTAGTQYSMSNFYGKSNRVSISYTFTSSTANASLAMSAIGGYASGASDITITVNSAVYLYATTTGNYGLNLTGGTAGDTVTLVNNGYIIGRGADGSGNNGGPALNVGIGVNITINNTNGSAYIGGGGGSGNARNGGGGGGAGGGGGGQSGCNGGGIGASGGNGAVCFCSESGQYNPGGGGGGGRILPGSGGGTSPGTRTGLGGGAGGGGGGGSGSGNGGSSNSAGSFGNDSAGGGGGWGASGGGTNINSGGSGGKAVNLNGKSVTWTSGDTSRVWGAVS
jgi:hypothetical protein